MTRIRRLMTGCGGYDEDTEVDDKDVICCSLMQQIISSVMCIDLLTPITKIVSERREHTARCSSSKMTSKFRSIYRDILFLTFTALGQANIHIGKLIYIYSYFSYCSELCIAT